MVAMNESEYQDAVAAWAVLIAGWLDQTRVGGPAANRRTADQSGQVRGPQSPQQLAQSGRP